MAKQFKKAKEKIVVSVQSPKEIKPLNTSTTQLAEPKAIWIFVLLFTLSLVLFGNTMSNGYSMDDELVTLNQPNVEAGFAGIPKILAARYSVNNKQHYEYRPIPLVTYAIEYQFFGRDPIPSHFFNIVFYALCALLVFLVVKKIFPEAHWILPLLTSLIFVVHPMHSEVAASLKNRDEILALIFALLSLGAFLNFTDRGKWKYVFFGFVFFMLALFSKKSAMPFIAIIPMIIILTRNVKPLKVIGLAAAVIVTTSLSGKLFLKTVLEKSDTLREMFFFENPLYTNVYGFGEKIMMALATFGYYVKMMFVPYPLVSYYGYNTFEGFKFGLNHAIGLLAIVVIIFLIYNYFRTNKPLVIGILLFCVSISMFANLVAPAVGIVAERFAFQASVGFCLALASGILMFTGSMSLKKGTKFNAVSSKIKITFLVITIASAIVIIPRNKAWNSTSSLYHTDVKILPECTKLHSLLGTIHANLLNRHVSGDTSLSKNALILHSDTAISHFKKALEIYPNYIAVNNNLGTIYFTYKSNLDSAGYYFNRACELDTAYVEAYFNLGNYYDQKAEIAAQKLRWINFELGGVDSSVDVSDKRSEASLALDNYEMLFFKIISLKTQLNNELNKILSGKGNGDPKAAILDAILYYYKDMKILREVEADHMGLADGLVQVLKRTKEMNSLKLASGIDSVVNKFYFPPFTKALLKDGKVKQAYITNELRKEIRNDLRTYREKCVANLRKSMRLNTKYMTAYTKLSQVLARWRLFDELIATHKAVLNNPNYNSYSVNFNLADSYFSKGDFKKSAEYLIVGLKELQRVTMRINKVINDFSLAQNNFALSTLARAKENNKAHINAYIKQFMYQISNSCPYEAVQIQQLFNMINTL
jgi:tetratricopeptide (TPR) repeat protein